MSLELDNNGINDNYEPQLSREEYIHIARENCLKQLEYSSIPYEDLSIKDENNLDELITLDGDISKGNYKYINIKFFMIRCIFAIVIFASILIIDKSKIKVGSFSIETIKMYVTDFDIMDKLEEVFLSLSK